MKITTMIAAGLVTLTGLAPVALATPAAAAQRTVVHERTVVRHVDQHRDRHVRRQVCSYQIRHHHRVRVCRTVYR